MFNHHPVFQVTMILLLLIFGPLASAIHIIDDHLVFTKRALRHPLINGLSLCSLWPVFIVIITILKSDFDTAYSTYYRLRSPEHRALIVNHLFKNIRRTLQRCSRVLNSMLAFFIFVAQIYLSTWLAADSVLASHFTAKDRTRSRPCSACGEREGTIGQLREVLDVTKEENRALKTERARSCIRVAGVRRVVKMQKARIATLKDILRGQATKGRELEMVKGKMAKLQDENRSLKEEKASLKGELARSNEEVEVTKAENQQLGEDLQSAKKTADDLTAQVIEAEASKEHEHTKRLAAESEVTTLRAQVSSLGTEFEEAKVARVVDLLVLKKERDSRMAERAALEKVKEEHAHEKEDLHLKLEEAKSSANDSVLGLETSKQDKAAVQEELHHAQGQLTITSEKNVALGTENKKLRQEVDELRSNGSGTSRIDEDIAPEGEANDADGAEDDDPLESLDKLKNYFAARDGLCRDVKMGGADLAVRKADEHEEMVVSDEAENTLLNDNSDGSLIVEAKPLEDTREMKEDSKTATEDDSSTVKDHNTPLVVPTAVKGESSAHGRHVCTSRCALVLPLPQASPPEVKSVPIYETPRPVVQPSVFPIVCPPSSSESPHLVPVPHELPSSLTLGAVDVTAHDIDTASLLPQKKSRPRRRRRHGSKEDGGQGAPTAAPAPVPAPSSSRSRRSHRPWFFKPKA